MRKTVLILAFMFLSMAFLAGVSSAGVGTVVKEAPIGSTAHSGVRPNVLIILDNSGSMLCPAYFTKADSSTISCSGPPSTSAGSIDDGYNPATTYYGYFDSASKYSYASNQFTINAAGDWSGNFLNWLTMRRIDVAKKVLVGGAGTPRARQALAAPNSIQGHQSTNSSFGNYAYIKQYPRAAGEAAGLFPVTGATDVTMYFGMQDGYIYMDDDANPFSVQIARLNIDINLTNEWRAGIIQQVSGQVRLGLEYFNSSQGGYIDRPMADPPVSIDYINAIENLDPDTYTPLAEALYTAAGYFGASAETSDNGPRYFAAAANSYNTSGANSDPFDFTVQNDVSCADSFVILISDGTPTSDTNIPAAPFIGSGALTDYDGDGSDNSYLEEVALWAHTTDLRADLPGTQSITLFTVFAFGGDAVDMANAAITGGFVDADGDNLPDPAHPQDWSSVPHTVKEWDKNADGEADTYFEAETGAELETALRSAFTTILAMVNTVTSPVIMPGVPGEGDNLYTSTFIPDMEHQWEGHLYKYPLDANGFLQGTSPDYIYTWEAGQQLGYAGTTPDQRAIFTMATTNTGGIIPGGINNFVESNWSELQPLMQINDSIRTLLGYDGASDSTYELSTKKLIRFIRGYDVFDEDLDSDVTDGRWKLADLYNSRPAVVGSPSNFYLDATDNNYITNFKTPQASRQTVVYAGGNDGMLHAFRSSNGEELWGYIPPIIIGSLKDMISPIAGQSQSQYYVDSSSIVEDAYINGGWKTALVNGLRWGGRGYFALDVTAPMDPRLLWSVSVDNTTVTHWNSDGATTTLAAAPYTISSKDYDYTKLGYSWSEPVTGRIKANLMGTPTDYWVALFGGGYRALQPDVNFSAADHAAGVGRQIFAVDVSDGSVLKRIDENTITDAAGDGIDNSIPATLSVVGDNDNYLQYAYAADREGQIWKFNISGSAIGGGVTTPASWSGCRIFDGAATYIADASNVSGATNNRRHIYAQPELTSCTGTDRWVLFGTGDARALDSVYPKLTGSFVTDAGGSYAGGDYGANNPDPKANEGNIFAALRDDDPSPALASGCGGSDKTGDVPFTLADLTNVTDDAVSMESSDHGWYVHLAEGEKSFTAPVVFAGYVLFTTFIPDTTDVCKLGTSYLHIVNACTGAPVGAGGTLGGVTLDTKKISLGSGRVTAPVISGNKIQMGVTGTPSQEDLDRIANLGGEWTGSIITLPSPAAMTEDEVRVISWKEM